MHNRSSQALGGPRRSQAGLSGLGGPRRPTRSKPVNSLKLGFQLFKCRFQSSFFSIFVITLAQGRGDQEPTSIEGNTTGFLIRLKHRSTDLKSVALSGSISVFLLVRFLIFSSIYHLCLSLVRFMQKLVRFMQKSSVTSIFGSIFVESSINTLFWFDFCRINTRYGFDLCRTNI